MDGRRLSGVLEATPVPDRSVGVARFNAGSNGIDSAAPVDERSAGHDRKATVALKKSDLYSSLWASCDQLRGGMDASQYKDYILTLLFVKYVSDKAKTDPNSLIDVPKGGSFDDMLAAKGDKEIGDRFNKIIATLAEANGLRNVIDQADFNDEEKLGKGKEMQDRLSKLVTIFNDLDFRGSRAEGDDLLGDAYEYLMRHFATESGKSKGQFYTPAEVSRILAKVVGIGPHTSQDHTVYDPACGSGSLLLKAAAEAPRGMTIYGQEKDNATWALSKMNMILHGNEIAEIEKGDTLTNPQFTRNDQLQTFDFVVMNPPFSVKSWSNGLEHDYGRFEYGRPRRRTATTPSCCTRSSPSTAPARPRSSCRTGCCSAATPRRRSAATCSNTASSKVSSGCRRTCSTAPASRPASSSSTRRTPRPAPGCS